ncbi:MAG: glycerate kinase [Rhodospirillaceae bacterium]
MTPAPDTLLRMLFDVAVSAAGAGAAVPRHLPPPPRGRTVVIGAGKAAAAMAASAEAHWKGPLAGLVVAPYGHGAPTSRIEVLEAAHPVPDAAGTRAAERIFEAVRGLTADDLVLALMSGGASALLALPAAGLTLDDKRQVTKSLLRSGATISEMNCVRKHLSAIKGGRLALAAAPAPVVTLVISDVPGDDPSTVGSGPTIADPTTFADARAILAKYRIPLPPAVARHMEAGADETPKPGDARLGAARSVIIADAKSALAAAALKARASGIETLVLGDDIEGEARDVAAAHAVLVLGEKRARPFVVISGGETTVTVRGKGRGGRNSEYLLALAVALDGARGVYALAADTDGIDGVETNAGAVMRPDTLSRARALGIDPAAHLADNDAFGFFAALGDLVTTGPTRTNVNDFRAILVT